MLGFPSRSSSGCLVVPRGNAPADPAGNTSSYVASAAVPSRWTASVGGPPDRAAPIVALGRVGGGEARRWAAVRRWEMGDGRWGHPGAGLLLPSGSFCGTPPGPGSTLPLWSARPT